MKRIPAPTVVKLRDREKLSFREIAAQRTIPGHTFRGVYDALVSARKLLARQLQAVDTALTTFNRL
jgi:hypothetical protein